MGARAQWVSSFAGGGDGGYGGDGGDGGSEAMAAAWLRLAKRERGLAGAGAGGSERNGNNDCGGGRRGTLETVIRGTTPLSGTKSTGVEDPAAARMTMMQ
jgi:hypothetical protein